MEEQVAFKGLPNRFSSVLSRDFRKEQGQYEDFDDLFALYVLYNVGKSSVRVNDETKLLEIAKSKNPMAYADAAALATQSAKADSEDFRRRMPFQRRGTEIGEPTDEGKKQSVPQAPVLDSAAAGAPCAPRLRLQPVHAARRPNDVPAVMPRSVSVQILRV